MKPEKLERLTTSSSTSRADRRRSRRSPLRPVVLIVDDDSDALRIYTWYLEAIGCVVETAHDGARAFDHARSLAPDVIVMDLAMPRVDGWEAIARLKASRETSRIPIIALTALESARARSRALGCSAFLAKPCLPELLFWQIRTVLRTATTRSRPRRR